MKKQILIPLCTVLGIGVIGGGIFFFAKYKSNQTVVEVTPVEYHANYDYGDSITSSGIISSDASQNIYNDSTKLIKEIFVKEGDSVSVGDKIIEYDMTLTEIELSGKEIALTKTDREISKLYKEITNLQNGNFGDLGPMVDNRMGSSTFAGLTPVTFMQRSSAAEASLSNDLSVLAGINIPPDDPGDDSTDESSESDSSDESSESDSATDESNGGSGDGAGGGTPDDSIDEGESIPDEPAPPSYTKEEVNAMIQERQMAIAKLQTSKKQINLDITVLKKTLENSTVNSAVTGTVTSVKSTTDDFSDGSPLISINSSEGLYITGTISELLLDTVEIGQTVSFYSWNNGISGEATITEISDYPSTSDSYSSVPNSSSYPFKAFIEDSSGLSNNDWVDITFTSNGGDTSSTFYLDKAYILNENGKKFVYIRDENQLLKKQEIVTGKILYGSYYEIVSGLSMSDYIAFPYGKGIKDGTKTQEASDTHY